MSSDDDHMCNEPSHAWKLDGSVHPWYLPSHLRWFAFDIAPIAKRIRAETRAETAELLAERWMMDEADLARSSNWGSMNAAYFENHLLDEIVAGNYSMTLRSRR